MPQVVKKQQVWDEEGIVTLTKSIGYYLVKVYGYRNPYWYLVKKSTVKECELFAGEEGDDWISLGAMANVESVAGVISYIRSQQKLRHARRTRRKANQLSTPARISDAGFSWPILGCLTCRILSRSEYAPPPKRSLDGLLGAERRYPAPASTGIYLEGDSTGEGSNNYYCEGSFWVATGRYGKGLGCVSS